MSRRKINICIECHTPLKHIQSNKWWCDQSPNMCKLSAKIKYLSNPEEEEQ